MRNGCGWAEVRALVLALALGGSAAAGAEANAIVADAMYSTSGVIEATRVSGPAVIAFHGVARDDLNAPGPLLLGEFQVEGLAAGVTATYNRTPFSIDLMMDGADPIYLSGVLDGTVTGGGAADVLATFSPTPVVPTYPVPPSGNERWIFGTDGITGILSLPDGGIALATRAGDGDPTVVRAQIRALEPIPSPEPASAAALLAGLAGIAWRRFRRSYTGRRKSYKGLGTED